MTHIGKMTFNARAYGAGSLNVFSDSRFTLTDSQRSRINSLSFCPPPPPPPPTNSPSTKEFTMKTNRRFLLAAIFGFALAFTFSCSGGGSGDDNWPSGSSSPSNSGGGTSSPSSGGGLVNAENEAWVECDANGKCYGMIFKQNGEFMQATYKNGNWCKQDYNSYKTYSISGNQITVSTGHIMTYSISGNTLTIVIDDDEQGTLERRSNVYVSVCGG